MVANQEVERKRETQLGATKLSFLTAPPTTLNMILSKTQVPAWKQLELLDRLLCGSSPPVDSSRTTDPTFPAPVVDLRVHDAVGIEPRVRKLRRYLVGHRACTICVLGPAGGGKTTLLKALNNDLLSTKHGFEIVIFASVTRDSSIERLQSVIARRLGLPWQESESQETKAVRLTMALEKRRFLLILDDLRNPLDLSTVGIPLPSSQNKCKVMFATRYDEVRCKMDAEKVYRLSPLDSEAAWRLFRKYAGEKASRSAIFEAAKSIAGECQGLPLGLMTVGRSLASPAGTREDWMKSLRSIKKFKQEEYSQRGSETSPLLPLFHFSFTRLGTKQLRECLMYLTLFPKNHSIKNDDLVRYWVGGGLIKDYAKISDARREGEKLIGKLKALGFLEDGNSPNSEVAMHDMFFDLASQIISKNEYIPSQTSLIPRRDEVRHNFFSEAAAAASSSLRLLDLSHSRIKAVPIDIGKMVSLMHLDLSFTKIKLLPKEIGELVNLVQLLLEGTTSLKIPGEVLPKFSKLFVLNLHASFGDWEVGESQECDRNQSKARMEELEGLVNLSDIGITICNTAAFERFRKSDRLVRSTRKLLVKDCDDIDSIHLSSAKFDSLREVTISDCSILKELKIGGSDKDGIEDRIEEPRNPCLSLLEVLRLKALYQAQVSWTMGVGVGNHEPAMLRELDVSFCHELRNVSWVLRLEHLERISIDTCKKVEVVVDGAEVAGARKLPRLRILRLRNLPQLKSICEYPLSLPALESVKVLRCPQLRSLPLRDDKGAPQVLVCGERKWWNGLDKDGEDKGPSSWYFQAAEKFQY